MSAKADRARLAKWSKSLMNEGFRELKWTCPLCYIGKFFDLCTHIRRMYVWGLPCGQDAIPGWLVEYKAISRTC